ncbi:MAG: carboxylating nicotinate-nucleotide diphosphorylase [Planctomycetaceae bacterium]|nr:carboxylating nicotinate-nucleotide diphosphorylase [Planctomycetaceae bacterium]
MKKDFNQIVWNEQLAEDVRKLIALAISEDLGLSGDITTLAIVPEGVTGQAVMRARQSGIVAGLVAAPTIAAAIDSNLKWESYLRDGAILNGDLDVLGKISGPFRSILNAERMILNLVGKLSGIATLTRRYIDEIDGTNAKIYDTRKTTLGWRRLEKYAVKCGGGMTHRTGLFDAILIKDNHLAFGASELAVDEKYTPAIAVRKAKQYGQKSPIRNKNGEQIPIVEIEVDSLEQLTEVLPERPDVVLLDNMSPETLRQAVKMRNESCGENPMNCEFVELEASGGVNLKTVRAIAKSGVERISVGAITHSAISLDVGLDF